jgi:Ca2+/H+ antiporter
MIPGIWELLPILLREWSNLPNPVGGELLTDHFHRLIFPRWDVIAIVLSIFLLTYTYIEAKSNYHRGSILILRQVLHVNFCIQC